MTRRLSITRRDFLGGVALGTAAGALAPAELLAAAGPAPYPPALTGLRGSHPGAFDVAHALAWEGREYPRPAEPDEAPYDLVVVGGGISGLAAAFYWRQAKGPDARILILDNHDDFGGHARRNEFTVDGELLVGYGGSQSIDTPGRYSPEAGRLLRDVGIVTDRFYEYFDQAFSERMGLDAGIWFSAEAYGRDVTAPGLDLWRTPDKRLDPAQVADRREELMKMLQIAPIVGDDTEPLRAQLDAFVGAIRSGGPSPVPGATAVKVLQLAERVLESVAHHLGKALHPDNQ